jgi:hypothetical protein
MNTTFFLYILLAILSIILLVILLTPKETRVEYVKEVPYPNYFAIWPSPYYRDWTGGASRTGGWYPPRHSGGHRTSYGPRAAGGSHGGGHGGGGH